MEAIMSKQFINSIIAIFLFAAITFGCAFSTIPTDQTGKFKSIRKVVSYDLSKLAAYRIRHEKQIIRMEALAYRHNCSLEQLEAQINDYQDLDDLEAKLRSARRCPRY